MYRYVIVCCCLFVNITMAQKLPGKQTSSIWAPGNIKIDGKTTEWNDKFEAYNLLNRVYYTISNDDKNLYLLLATSDHYSFTKVLYGSVTFIIQSPAEKPGQTSKELTNIAITYPAWVKELKGSMVDLDLETRGFIKMNDTTIVSAKRNLDSANLVINKKLTELFKEIKVENIPEIQDSLISIYNSTGIKVSARYNQHLQYVYELAIPLKYLGKTTTNGKKFKYNIKLNGRPDTAGGGVIYSDVVKMLGADNLYVDYPTNIEGEYTLAKKP